MIETVDKTTTDRNPNSIASAQTAAVPIRFDCSPNALPKTAAVTNVKRSHTWENGLKVIKLVSLPGVGR